MVHNNKSLLTILSRICTKVLVPLALSHEVVPFVLSNGQQGGGDNCMGYRQTLRVNLVISDGSQQVAVNHFQGPRWNTCRQTFSDQNAVHSMDHTKTDKKDNASRIWGMEKKVCGNVNMQIEHIEHIHLYHWLCFSRLCYITVYKIQLCNVNMHITRIHSYHWPR